jgi:hypothetical protein
MQKSEILPQYRWHIFYKTDNQHKNNKQENAVNIWEIILAISV